MIALVALFVALAGSAYAAKIGANKVKSKHIKDGQVKTNDIADLGVGTVDLADGSVATTKLADGSVTGPKLGAASVGTANIADNAVNSAKVAADTLTAADIAANAIGTAELANDSVTSAKVDNETLTTNDIQSDAVQGDEVENGSLDDVDVGVASGTLVFDPPNTGANTCLFSGNVPLAGVTVGDHVLITPPDTFATLDVTLQANVVSAGNIRINTCNGTNAAQNAPSGNFSVLVFNQ